MSKTYYKTLLKLGKFQIDIQRFNKGYKNLPTVFYKNGIRKVQNENSSMIQLVISNYKLLFIKFY